MYMSKLSKLEKELKKLQSKRYKRRRNFEHHRRELDKATDPKDYEKHYVKEQFYKRELGKIDLEIKRCKGQIADMELERKHAQYMKTLKAFDQSIVELLVNLLKPLDILVSEARLTEDISELSKYARRVYITQKQPFKKVDLAPYENLRLSSIPGITTVCDRIIEEYSDMERISSLRGPSIAAQKRSNVQLWAKHLVSQIRDCIKTVEKRRGL